MGKLIFQNYVISFVDKKGGATCKYGYYVTFSRINEKDIVPIKMRLGIVAGAEFYRYDKHPNKFIMVCPLSELVLYRVLMEQFDPDLFKFKFLEIVKDVA